MFIIEHKTTHRQLPYWGGVKGGWVEWLWRYCKQYNQKLFYCKYLIFTSFFLIMLITNLLFVLVVSVTNFAGNMPGGTPKQNSPGVRWPFPKTATLFTWIIEETGLETC